MRAEILNLPVIDVLKSQIRFAREVTGGLSGVLLGREISIRIPKRSLRRGRKRRFEQVGAPYLLLHSWKIGVLAALQGSTMFPEYPFCKLRVASKPDRVSGPRGHSSGLHLVALDKHKFSRMHEET